MPPVVKLVKRADGSSYVPTPERCAEIFRELRAKGLNFSESSELQVYFEGDVDVGSQVIHMGGDRGNRKKGGINISSKSVGSYIENNHSKIVQNF